MKIKVVVKLINGFTLVELLLGLAISTIIGLSVYNMFWQAMKLDDKMRHVHESYTEVLMADYALSHDLENAIKLDFSGSYPDAKNFDGQKTEFSFLTKTPKGIKHVRYYSGLLNGAVAKSMIGRVVNESSNLASSATGALPIEFLLRQESSLADWLNETTSNTSTQIIAAGFKKESFNCQYASFSKDLHAVGSKGIDYTDTWDKNGLPLVVSCNFVLYDPKKPEEGLAFKRDIFLSPVLSYHDE